MATQGSTSLVIPGPHIWRDCPLLGPGSCLRQPSHREHSQGLIPESCAPPDEPSTLSHRLGEDDTKRDECCGPQGPSGRPVHHLRLLPALP